MMSKHILNHIIQRLLVLFNDLSSELFDFTVTCKKKILPLVTTHKTSTEPNTSAEGDAIIISKSVRSTIATQQILSCSEISSIEQAGY